MQHEQESIWVVRQSISQNRDSYDYSAWAGFAGDSDVAEGSNRPRVDKDTWFRQDDGTNTGAEVCYEPSTGRLLRRRRLAPKGIHHSQTPLSHRPNRIMPFGRNTHSFALSEKNDPSCRLSIRSERR